jgi:hypothetical protein
MLVEKHKETYPWTTKAQMVDNIKMNLKEMGWEGMD